MGKGDKSLMTKYIIEPIGQVRVRFLFQIIIIQTKTGNVYDVVTLNKKDKDFCGEVHTWNVIDILPKTGKRKKLKWWGSHVEVHTWNVTDILPKRKKIKWWGSHVKCDRHLTQEKNNKMVKFTREMWDILHKRKIIKWWRSHVKCDRHLTQEMT